MADEDHLRELETVASLALSVTDFREPERRRAEKAVADQIVELCGVHYEDEPGCSECPASVVTDAAEIRAFFEDMRPKAKIADHIDVQRDADGYRLTIDGQGFPWHIHKDGVDTTVHGSDYPMVTLTIPADRVTVDNGMPPFGRSPEHPA